MGHTAESAVLLRVTAHNLHTSYRLVRQIWRRATGPSAGLALNQI
jgi:hypothetical protein